jgi:hypothetical protein
MRMFLAAAILAASTIASYAACPAGTRYQCTQMPNGKMMCSCV